MIPLLGFAPDLDETTPGVMTACTNLIPHEKGMQGGPAPVAPVGVGALAAACRGAAVLTLLSGTRRLFAGTQTKMYELTGTTWDDVSRVGDYTGSAENRWSFAQFGNTTVAANDTEVLQASTSSGDFADIATAPTAKIVIAVANFLIAFNTVDGTFGDRPDGWWCCAFMDHTSWAPSVTTQANNGRLVGEGGEITAAARLGRAAVAFKAGAMFFGTYVGSPAVWQWDQVPGQIGCVGPEAVCDIGGILLFLADDNFYVFDGTAPIPIGGEVRQWFLDNSSSTYRYRTQISFDRQKNRVWVCFPGKSSSGACDSVLVYHVVTKRWGSADRTVEAVLNYVSPGLTFDSIGAVYSTWDDLPDIPYDSQFWLAGGQVFSLFDSTHQVVNMVGASVSSGFSTGDMGDDDLVTMIDYVRLRFLQTPSAATVTGSVKQVEGDDLDPGASGTLADGKFDVRQSGRWHRLAFELTGPASLNGIKPKMIAVGGR